MTPENTDTPLKADCSSAPCSGFLIKMRDGTQYLIPIAKFIEAEIADTLNVWNKEMEETGEETPATPEQAREWAESKFTQPWHSADIDDLFVGTQWSEFADIAIKLPTDPLSPDDLWDETAEISFIPNIPISGGIPPAASSCSDLIEKK
jgi:hypothetical protein